MCKFLQCFALALSWALVFTIIGARPAFAELSSDPIVVEDDTGTIVELAKPAMRVISIAPHATELLFAAGAGNQVIAVGEYSDFPEAAKLLPRVGDAERLDFEQIVSLKPDLIVAWASGNRSVDIERLEAFGLHVYKTEPRTFELIATNIERLGQLTNHSDIAAKAASNFRAKTARLRETRRGAARVKTFYQVWKSPLMTLNGDHIISEVIELCGGENIFRDMSALVPQVDIEAVIARNPAVILSAGDSKQDLDALKSYWLRFPDLAANRTGALFSLPTDLISRSGPRIVDGAEALCAALDAARSY